MVLGFMVQGLGFRVHSLGFRVQIGFSLGLRVQGCGFRVVAVVVQCVFKVPHNQPRSEILEAINLRTPETRDRPLNPKQASIFRSYQTKLKRILTYLFQRGPVNFENDGFWFGFNVIQKYQWQWLETGARLYFGGLDLLIRV